MFDSTGATAMQWRPRKSAEDWCKTCSSARKQWLFLLKFFESPSLKKNFVNSIMPRISILLVLVITIFRNSACAVVSEESDFFFFCDLVSLLQVYNVEPEPHHIDAGGRVASARRLQRTAVLPHLRDDDGRSLTNATRKHRNLEGVSLEESNIQRTGEGALALDAQALLPVVQFLVQGSGQDVDERDKVGWKDVDVGDVRDVWQAWLSSSASVMRSDTFGTCTVRLGSASCSPCSFAPCVPLADGAAIIVVAERKLKRFPGG